MSPERTVLERLTDRFLAGQITSSEMTVAEREAVHLLALARAARLTVRIDTTSKGKRWLRVVGATALVLIPVFLSA
jgi:hypothetical protein